MATQLLSIGSPLNDLLDSPEPNSSLIRGRGVLNTADQTFVRPVSWPASCAVWPRSAQIVSSEANSRTPGRRAPAPSADVRRTRAWPRNRLAPATTSPTTMAMTARSGCARRPGPRRRPAGRDAHVRPVITRHIHSTLECRRARRRSGPPGWAAIGQSDPDRRPSKENARPGEIAAPDQDGAEDDHRQRRWQRSSSMSCRPHHGVSSHSTSTKPGEPDRAEGRADHELVVDAHHQRDDRQHEQHEEQVRPQDAPGLITRASSMPPGVRPG